MDALADVARALHDEPSTTAVLAATCRAAVLLVPECSRAEVTGPRGEVLAASGLRLASDLPPELVAEALAQHRWVRTTSSRHLALPLWFGESTIGVLGLTATPTFDDEAVRTASALATHAALACARALDAQRLVHVQTALQTNRGIGIAIGIVMARSGVSQDEAFEVLRVASQHENRKLRDIAETVVLTGEVPRPPVPTRPSHRAGRG